MCVPFLHVNAHFSVKLVRMCLGRDMHGNRRSREKTIQKNSRIDNKAAVVIQIKRRRV